MLPFHLYTEKGGGEADSGNGRREGWWAEMTERKEQILLRMMSMEREVCLGLNQHWEAALCWSLWSSAWGLVYVSQEHGDICAIIYSQQIRWEAQGLLREGIIWGPKDQPGQRWAHRIFCSKIRTHRHNSSLLRRVANGSVIRTELQQRQLSVHWDQYLLDPKWWGGTIAEIWVNRKPVSHPDMALFATLEYDKVITQVPHGIFHGSQWGILAHIPFSAPVR